jgi:hypothetical protein
MAYCLATARCVHFSDAAGFQTLSTWPPASLFKQGERVQVGTMEIDEIIKAMNMELDVMENPKGFGREAKKEALHGLAEATNTLKHALKAIAASTARQVVSIGGEG